MTLSIQQLADDSKFSHALRFEVLEQLCPRELVSELLSRCHAWGERERSLNQLLVVYYVISLSLFRRLNLAAVLGHLVRGLSMLVHQQQAHGLARLKAGRFIHAEQVLSDGSYLVTLHPLGLPAVQVRIIEYRIEPHTAQRLAEFPSSQTSNHADPNCKSRLSSGSVSLYVNSSR